MSKDVAVNLTNGLMLEINALLASPLTIGGSLMLPIVGGAAMGSYSAIKAKEGNERMVNNLIQAKKNCPNQDCIDKIDDKIRKLNLKIKGAPSSAVKRGLLGIATTGFGAHLYHNHERNKKIRSINKMRRNMNLSDELKKCEKLPKKAADACREKIQTLINQLHGKSVYRKIY